MLFEIFRSKNLLFHERVDNAVQLGGRKFAFIFYQVIGYINERIAGSTIVTVYQARASSHLFKYFMPVRSGEASDAIHQLFVSRLKLADLCSASGGQCQVFFAGIVG